MGGGGVDAPATAEQAALGLLDYANLKVFGNSAFRPRQKAIIKAVMQVLGLRPPAPHASARDASAQPMRPCVCARAYAGRCR